MFSYVGTLVASGLLENIELTDDEAVENVETVEDIELVESFRDSFGIMIVESSVFDVELARADSETED